MIKMNIPMYREFQKKEFGNKNETMSMSQVFSKIRTYEKLVNTDITTYTKEKLNNLKKQIIFYIYPGRSNIPSHSPRIMANIFCRT